jgi:hypothetical protein
MPIFIPIPIMGNFTPDGPAFGRPAIGSGDVVAGEAPTGVGLGTGDEAAAVGAGTDVVGSAGGKVAAIGVGGGAAATGLGVGTGLAGGAVEGEAAVGGGGNIVDCGRGSGRGAAGSDAAGEIEGGGAAIDASSAGLGPTIGKKEASRDVSGLPASKLRNSSLRRSTPPLNVSETTVLISCLKSSSLSNMSMRANLRRESPPATVEPLPEPPMKLLEPLTEPE